MFPKKFVHNVEIKVEVFFACLPDTPLHKTAQLFNQGVVRAGVVEHHYRPVLNVVKPSLGWYKSVEK